MRSQILRFHLVYSQLSRAKLLRSQLVRSQLVRCQLVLSHRVLAPLMRCQVVLCQFVRSSGAALFARTHVDLLARHVVGRIMGAWRAADSAVTAASSEPCSACGRQCSQQKLSPSIAKRGQATCRSPYLSWTVQSRVFCNARVRSYRLIKSSIVSLAFYYVCNYNG